MMEAKFRTDKLQNGNCDTTDNFVSPNTADFKTQTSHTVRFKNTATPQAEILFTATPHEKMRNTANPQCPPLICRLYAQCMISKSHVKEMFCMAVSLMLLNFKTVYSKTQCDNPQTGNSSLAGFQQVFEGNTAWKHKEWLSKSLQSTERTYESFFSVLWVLAQGHFLLVFCLLDSCLSDK